MKRDLYHIFQSGHGDTANGAVVSIVAAAQETAQNGTAADLKGYRGALIVANVGAFVSGDDNTITIEESDDNSAFSAVANADLRGGDNAIVVDGTADASVVYLRGYVGNKRYVRVAIAASATTGHIIGAVIMRGERMNRGNLNETA